MVSNIQGLTRKLTLKKRIKDARATKRNNFNQFVCKDIHLALHLLEKMLGKIQVTHGIYCKSVKSSMPHTRSPTLKGRRNNTRQNQSIEKWLEREKQQGSSPHELTDLERNSYRPCECPSPGACPDWIFLRNPILVSSEWAEKGKTREERYSRHSRKEKGPELKELKRIVKQQI